MKIAGGDKNPLDAWSVFGVLGTILGGFVSGWLNGRSGRPAYHRTLGHGLPGWSDHGLRQLCALHLRPAPSGDAIAGLAFMFAVFGSYCWRIFCGGSGTRRHHGAFPLTITPCSAIGASTSSIR